MSLQTQMEEVISSSYQNMAGMVVRKNGKTQYEKYFNGCTAANAIHISSVTKSIISILLGIAMDKGYIKSINQRVLEFFPDHGVRMGEETIQNITLRDMLTMTAPYTYEAEPYAEYFASDNWVMSALALLGGKGKIGEFRYAPLIGPDILSGILVNATGQSVLAFAEEHLFSPLGILVEGSIVFHDEQEQLAWYGEKHVTGWVADRMGVNTAGWGLSLTATDMAKIGQLYADHGVWDGKQVVSPEWVQECTKRQSRCEQWGLSYGYLWWIIDEEEHAYAAMGDGGNIIYVNGKKKMVIAIASYFMPQAEDRIKLIKEYVVPAFDGD